MLRTVGSKFLLGATASSQSIRVPFSHCSFQTMASQTFKQDPHNLLVIPGPVEVADEVLYQNAHPSHSHMAPDFAAVFQDSIKKTRQVLCSKDASIFLIAGSGTLGWDQAASNLLEPGDKALVLNSGYFGDSFAECIEAYGGKVTQIVAPVGGRVSQDQLASALSKDKYKIVTFTHVDTSTGVLSDAKAIAETVKKVSPETLVVSDAVCAVASEEIRFDEWGLDVVITASQKGLGAPPGLSVVAASPRAIKAYENRKTPPASYYSSWKKWLPVMKAYDSGSAAYFATPPVNLIYAYNAALKLIVEGSVSLEERFKMHKEASDNFKNEVTKLGLKQVPLDADGAANGMTAIYVPEGLQVSDIVPKMLTKGVVVAAGLHKDIKTTYFRVGHMGVTIVDKKRQDMETVTNALKSTLQEAGYKKD